MRKLIAELAERFDDATRVCIISIRVAMIAFISAMFGMVLLATVELEIGKIILFISVPIGAISVFVGLIGLIFKWVKDRDDLREYRKRYENPKQPWE